MGVIKVLKNSDLQSGTGSEAVYPVTSTRAVFDGNNENIDDAIKRKGLVNISTNYNNSHTAEVLSLGQAIAKVPLSDRVLGFSGTYLSESGWEQLQFIGNSISEWGDISKWSSLSLKSFQDIDGNTLPIIGFSTLSITLDTSTKKFTYDTFTVFYGKTKFSYLVPAGSGTYINGSQNILGGLNTIFFNIVTKEVAWVTFERYSDYIGRNNKNWIVLEHFYGPTPVIGFIHAKKSDGTWLSKSDYLDNKITSIPDYLGNFYGNLIKGSDLVIGYTESEWNFNALTNISGINSIITREFSQEILKYVFKVLVKAGSKTNDTYQNGVIKTIKVNIPQGQKFYVGVRYKVSKPSSAIPLTLHVVANNTILDGGIKELCPIEDNNWHYNVIELSSDTADITEIKFSIYVSATSSQSYSENCSIEFTDLLVSLSKADELIKQINEQDYKILGEYDELQSLKSTGILWSNLFIGSDMEKGYDENNIPGFSTYPSLGGTIERVLDSETSRYCIKGYFPKGTNFSAFAYPQLFTDINFVGENTTQEFSISFRYKCTSNLQNIHLLCNNSFMEYTDINGTPISKMPLIKDNNWHYLHVIAKKSGVTNKNYTIGLYIYFAGSESNTLTSDLEFYITDIVISPSRFPDYAVVRNVNDYITPVNKETIKPVVNEIINEYPDIHNCVFMSLGDSITTEGYYIGKLRQLISPSKYYNLAVSGAHWADYVDTIYDGNPVLGGNNINNVLGNQVQKIINNPDIYNTAPDVIIIAAGTNDTTPITADKTDYEMRVEIDSHFNENSTTPIQVTEPTFDESDTYKEHRRTIAGAMRYCILKLQSLYPSAKIYILTPIQGSYNPNKDYLTQIEIKQRYITEVAKHLSVPVIHVGEECGISRDFEYGGTYWKEEWDPNNNKTGRDLFDGLHPNTNGSWKMAKYIYNKLKNYYIN